MDFLESMATESARCEKVLGQKKVMKNTINFVLLSVITEGRKEGNFVFNDALNTFYLWL